MDKIAPLTLLFLTISGAAYASPELDKASQDVCKCLEASYSQHTKSLKIIEEAKTSGDMSQLMAAQDEMMAVMGATSQCFESLPEKYPEIDQNDDLKGQVMAMAETRCPNPMKNDMK